MVGKIYYKHKLQLIADISVEQTRAGIENDISQI